MKLGRAVLADTSVWVDHFRNSEPRMAALLRAKRVRMHPFVASELALGALLNRVRTLADLRSLSQTPVADQAEIDNLIESRRLYARGIGFVDLHLIASALLDGNLSVWTLDKRFADVAGELGVRADL
ncbi:MAG TPA: PIN domain-containing protein [Terracidiphilus sp.]